MRKYVIALMALVVLAAIGCGEARSLPQPVPNPEPTPWSDLANLGSVLVWTGGISAALGIAARVLAFVYPPLAIVSGIAGFAAIAGSSITVTGSACIWLAANPWVVLGCAAASAAGVVWWYWPRLHRAFDRRLAGKV